MTRGEAKEIGFVAGAEVIAIKDVYTDGIIIVRSGETGVIEKLDYDDSEWPVRVKWVEQNCSWWCHWNDIKLNNPQDEDDAEPVICNINSLLFGRESAGDVVL